MYLKAIILASIVLGITLGIVIKDFKEKGFSYIKALIGIAIALTFLSYPLYSEYTGISRLACTVLFAVQVLTLNQDFELINIVEASDIVNNVYIVLTYILYFVAPLLSASTLISLFGHTFSRLRFLITLKSEYHIFSEINEKTVATSKAILANNKNAKIVQNKINLEAPELLKKYNIEFLDKSIEEVISENLLTNIKINYAIVTVGADSNNLNIAVALRRYFLVNNFDDVIIDIGIRNTYKSKNVQILKDDTDKAYNFNTLGSIEETYFKNPIINSDIEKMAEKLHEINSSGKEENRKSYNSEYNRKSSRASVVHIKYKLFSILQDKYTGNIDTDLEKYKELIKNPKTIDLLAKNEHDRWMAYMCTVGYKVAPIETVEKYYLKIGGKHKHSLARLHPALVENDKLLEVQEQVDSLIEKLTGTRGNCNFTTQDKDIVQKLDIILGK